MKQGIMRIIFLILLSLGALLPLAHAEGPSQASRDRVNQLILTRLATGLNLNEAETQKLGVILKQHRDRKRDLRGQIQQLTAQLRQDTQVGDKKQTEATLKKLQETKDQLDRSDEVMFAEVKTMLDANQLAQFVLIMDEIRHEVTAARRHGTRQIGPATGTAPAAATPQQEYTNKPYPPGYYPGYAPYPPREGGVWVSD
jgi:TolA-binding protein